MAQPTFTPFVVNGSCDNVTMNAAFAGIVAQSSNVDGLNIRNEGLDRNMIPAGAVLKYSLSQTIGNSTAYSYGTAGGPNIDCTNWVTVQELAGPTLLRLDNGGAGFTINPSTLVARVRASVEVRRIQSTLGDLRFAFAFFYRLAGGADTIVPYTYRELGITFQVNYNSTSLTIEHVVYPYVAGAMTFDYIDLRVKSVGATAPGAAASWLYLSEAFMDLDVREH